MTQTTNTIIPPFQTIFEEISPDEDLIKELSKHNSIEQSQMFEAFKEIFQDEIMFVLTAYRAHKKEKSEVRGLTVLSRR